MVGARPANFYDGAHARGMCFEPGIGGRLVQLNAGTEDRELRRVTAWAPGERLAYETGRSQGTHEGFAALDGDGRFVGLGLAPHIDREDREAALGYIVVDNHASYRIAQRCGYQREGVMRSIHVKQQHRADAVLWSRLPGDPS